MLEVQHNVVIQAADTTPGFSSNMTMLVSPSPWQQLMPPFVATTARRLLGPLGDEGSGGGLGAQRRGAKSVDAQNVTLWVGDKA